MGVVSEREASLLQMLVKNKKMSVSDIIKTFSVSEPTARRMCQRLEREGRVLRLRGSIVLKPELADAYTYSVNQLEYPREKRKIAEYAVRLVKNNSVVFLEAGTTVAVFTEVLTEKIQAGEIKNCTLFTNSLVNLHIIGDVCPINIIGGLYRSHRKDFGGHLAQRTIRNLNFDYCFLGADAISTSEGVMSHGADTAEFDELLLSRSQKKYILTHSEKFGKVSLLSCAPLKDIDLFITDSGLDEETQTSFKAAGAHIICV